MIWLKYISLYLAIGALVGGIMDGINKNNPDPEMRYGTKERIGIVLLWPLPLGVFLYYFFNPK